MNCQTQCFKLFRRGVLMMMFLTLTSHSFAQHSVAREWNEAFLHGIRNDFARPTVHARNLFHASALMYDAWAFYDSRAEPYFIGKTIDSFCFCVDDFPPPPDTKAAQQEAMAYACYRLGLHRFKNAPKYDEIEQYFTNLLVKQGYSPFMVSENYKVDGPAAFGNYLAKLMIQFGLVDGAGEQIGYNNTFYFPKNQALVTELPGNPNLKFPNNWQPLALALFIDQSGNPIPQSTPDFLSPEWGFVHPFGLKPSDAEKLTRGDDTMMVYLNPAPPPYLDTNNCDLSAYSYQWGFSLVSDWASHLTTEDGVMVDISPKGMGNNLNNLPNTTAEMRAFYDIQNPDLLGNGYDINPITKTAYKEQIVPRGDFTRVLAEFWADGPDSETPPGHWFTLLNYVNDHPDFRRQFKGKGPILDPLEWDVKSYLLMGGAMHDCAVATWSVKGYHDYVRPISALRYMADQGQCTDPNAPNYSKHGIPLIPGKIEIMYEVDPLVLNDSSLLHQIKLYTWKGHDYINDPDTDVAGVGWVPANLWWPYQRPSFVTPPFAGYVSGHSTFSRAGAEILTQLTGSSYFPGGMGEFEVLKDSFLVFEDGPSMDFKLQWATYYDAAHQSALSRIWGGIHPPFDDIPGRKIGDYVARAVLKEASPYFNLDQDGDHYPYYADCDDNNPNINPGMPEVCDSLDNNCDGKIDEGLELIQYFTDLDQDGFGDAQTWITTCASTVPSGYVLDSTDCDDMSDAIYPNAVDTLNNGVDEDCSGSDSTSAVSMQFLGETHSLVIELFNQDQCVLEVTNLMGQKVHEATLLENEHTVVLEGLTQGLYTAIVLNQQNERILYTKFFYGPR